ncbi:MAG: ABC transporter substrate-binding protein [Planctomycetaceae bacterium]|nr:ABC transporter substrate-binding protein [Planctomycetaceae bacterium]
MWSPRSAPAVVRLANAARACAFAPAASLLLWLVLPLGGTFAQNAGERIIDREPFDRMTLDNVNENKVILLKPVSFPGRRVPAEPKPSEKLRVRLLENNQEYEIAWQHIEKFELFEQMVLAEAGQLAAAGNFDEAYAYLTFLFDYYPTTAGLAEAQQAYLYQSSGAAFKQQRFDEALGIVEELWAQNPQFRAAETAPALKTVLGNIADKLIGQYVAKEDFRSARTLLSRLISRYQAQDEPFARRWQDELSQRAAARRDEARAHLEAGRFIQAYDACAAMRLVWPNVPGGAELAAEVARRHPLVIVGVEHPAADFNARDLINPGARRAGRLVQRGLLEFAGPGPEGGRYVCPLGTAEQSVDGLEVLFNLRPNAELSGYDLSRLLLRWARPGEEGFEPSWARTLESVGVSNVTRVTARLKAPHVLPQALLQGSYGTVGSSSRQADQAGAKADDGNGAYQLFSHSAELTRYSLRQQTKREPGQVAEVAERLYTDPQRAILGLKRGEIDVLERVFPGDLPAVQSDSELAVSALAMPTSHLLLLRDKHPYLANRTFRRGLVYGIDRQQILSQGLLRGQELAGFGVISAPFPAPFGSGDSQAYAYDKLIEPRPYDPRLALTLRLLSQNEVKSFFEKQQQQAPALTPILLGHPADEASRIACRAIVRQWEAIGVKCKLNELPPGVVLDGGECDAVYVQAAVWEPIVDAARLLGPEGLAPAKSAFIQLTLRQIERAANWQEARERFRQLHRLLHEDVTVIPLFQTFDYYAYRKSWSGLEASRVSLYENIADWRFVPDTPASGATAGGGRP